MIKHKKILNSSIGHSSAHWGKLRSAHHFWHVTHVIFSYRFGNLTVANALKSHDFIPSCVVEESHVHLTMGHVLLRKVTFI
jgi:hypothetical protein